MRKLSKRVTVLVAAAEAAVAGAGPPLNPKP